MSDMGAREASLNSALLFQKYGFGFGFCAFGIALFTRTHPFVSGFIALGFCGLGSFFLTVARVKLEEGEIKYRRLFRWHAIAYSGVRECGESWVFGYVRPSICVSVGEYLLCQPNSSDSPFGWDQKILSCSRNADIDVFAGDVPPAAQGIFTKLAGLHRGSWPLLAVLTRA
jgi:hypothetical protein